MTADMVGGVPNQPKTPQRTFRCPDALWEAARKKAKRRGESVSAVLVRALREYVSD